MLELGLSEQCKTMKEKEIGLPKRSERTGYPTAQVSGRAKSNWRHIDNRQAWNNMVNIYSKVYLNTLATSLACRHV